MKFGLGRTVMTRGAASLIENGLNVFTYLSRHANGDWGDLGADDKAANDHAVIDGDRIFSAYETAHGKIWIITEHDRSATTVLLPSEY